MRLPLLESAQGRRYRFKYVSARRLNEIISSEKIHFSRPKEFNDPFEQLEYLPPRDRVAYAKRIEKLLARLEQGADWLNDGYEAWEEQFQVLYGKPAINFPVGLTTFGWDWWYRFDESRKIKQGYSRDKLDTSEKRLAAIDKNKYDEKYAILSLAARNDSLLMWAHYADQHKGAVIELDVNHEDFNLVRASSTRYKTVDLFNTEGDERGIQMAQDVTYRESNIRPLLVPTERILMRHFFEKSYQWEYEQEYRIIRQKQDSNSGDHTDFGALFPLPLAALKTIILGQRFKKNRSIDGSAERVKAREKFEQIRKLCAYGGRNDAEPEYWQKKTAVDF